MTARSRGDVIVRFDGKTVDTMRDLPRVVAESPVGKAVDVVVIRGGEEVTVKVTLGRLEDSEQVASAETGGDDGEADLPATLEILGMTLAELDDEGREQFGIADTVEGVVITEVDPDSAAAEKRIEPGDVIVEIAQDACMRQVSGWSRWPCCTGPRPRQCVWSGDCNDRIGRR
jgi:serine protease Do